MYVGDDELELPLTALVDQKLGRGGGEDRTLVAVAVVLPVAFGLGGELVGEAAGEEEGGGATGRLACRRSRVPKSFK